MLIFTLAKQKEVAQIVPIIVMIVLYPVLYQKQSSVFVDLEDPDGFYYMGFIFTLGFFIVSFLSFAVDGSFTAKGIKQEDILKTFGLGLLTTFLGLVGRITLLQIKNDPNQATASAISRLNTAAARLSDNVADLALKIRDSTTDITSALSDLILETVSATKGTKDYAKGLDEQLGKLKAAGNGVVRFGEQMDSATKQIEHEADRWVGSADRLVEATFRIAESANETQQSISGLGRSAREGAEMLHHSIGSIVVATTSLLTGFKELEKGVTGTMPSVIVSLASLNTGIQGTSGNLKEFSNTLQSTGATITGTNEELTAMSTKVRDLRATVQDTTSTITAIDIVSAVRTLALELDVLRDGSNKTGSSLVAVVASTKETNDAMTALAHQAKQLTEHLSKVNVILTTVDNLQTVANVLPVLTVELNGMSNGVHELNECLEGAVALIGDKGIAKEVRALTGGVQALTSSVNLASSAVGTVQRTAAVASTEIAQAISSVTGRLKAIEAVIEAMAVGVRDFNSGLEDSLAFVTDSDVGKEFHNLSRQLAELGKSADAAHVSIGTVPGVAAASIEKISSLNDQVQGLSKELAQIQTLLTSLEMPEWDVAENLKRSQEAVLAVHTSLVKLTDGLIKRIS